MEGRAMIKLFILFLVKSTILARKQHVIIRPAVYIRPLKEPGESRCLALRKPNKSPTVLRL